MSRARTSLTKTAQRLLAQLASQPRAVPIAERGAERAKDLAALVAADLVARDSNGELEITAAGRAWLKRQAHDGAASPVEPFRAQHLSLAQATIADAQAQSRVVVDESESPLGWLARRKGRDGRPLIEPVQLQAGERLRADFTRAQLTPRTTANWSAPIAQSRRGESGPGANFTEATVAARQRVDRALHAVGPEFAGLLLDVCCFLKGLADVEHERGWPPRAAKIVLQFGLDQLARHYGLASEARGTSHARVRTWLAPGAHFAVDAEHDGGDAASG